MRRRFQFSLKWLFVAMLVAASAIHFGAPYWHRYAPKWGEPRHIEQGNTLEARYWTGRQVAQGRLRADASESIDAIPPLPAFQASLKAD